MRNAYRDELDHLAARLLRLTRATAEALERATVALEEADAVLADEVVADSVVLDRGRIEAEQHAQTILALQAPVATELRVVLAAVHALTELERMGRLAVLVAKAVQRRYPHPVVPHVLTPRFVEMGRIAVWLGMMAAEVTAKRDVVLARSLISVDDDLDDLHRTLFTVLDCQDWPHGTATAVDCALLSRYYERFADRAVALARLTTFVVTGRPAWRAAA